MQRSRTFPVPPTLTRVATVSGTARLYIAARWKTWVTSEVSRPYVSSSSPSLGSPMSPAISSIRSCPAAALRATSITRGSPSAASRSSDRSSSSLVASRLPMNPGYPVSRASAIRRPQPSPSQRPEAPQRPHGSWTGRTGAALEHDREAQIAVTPSAFEFCQCLGIAGCGDLAVQAVDLSPQLDLGRRHARVAQDLVDQPHVGRHPRHVVQAQRPPLARQVVEVPPLDCVLDLRLGDPREDAHRRSPIGENLSSRVQLADCSLRAPREPAFIAASPRVHILASIAV